MPSHHMRNRGPMNWFTKLVRNALRDLWKSVVWIPNLWSGMRDFLLVLQGVDAQLARAMTAKANPVMGDAQATN